MSSPQFVPVDLEPKAPPAPTQPQPDSFTDDLFAPLDTRKGPGDFVQELGAIAEQEDTPLLPPEATGQPQPEPTPAPAPAPAVTQPEVIQYEDGSSITIEKTNKGWRAVLDAGTSANAEIFYGKTKDEMWTNVAAGKINATRHIRDLNKKLKLTARPEPLPVTTNEPQPQPRRLTTEEVFELKNQLASDPGLAFDTYMQKRTGLTIDQLVALATEGRNARKELDAEAVARVFKAQHPDYLMCDENYRAMVGWLARYKLNKTLTDSNQNEIMNALYDRGFWNPENLGEAFEDLAQDGLLEFETSEEEEPEPAPPAPAPPQPAPAAPQSPRIANVRVGQRAGLGIRTREVNTPAREPEPNRPPSDDDFDRMTDEELAAQFASVRRYASQHPR